MSQLGASRFTEFYRALHGKDLTPFPWQARLAQRVCSGSWPRVIALPTAAGKTACIDIALFALACQADAKEQKAPRRIFFVVDRRVIVDQAYLHARKIAAKLEQPDSPILQEVAERLRWLGRSDRPLDCFQLRGGIYRDDSWARTPLQPTVIASTVDQVGSRLLYRGYGLRSGSARPIHAGLAANDSLILLDEAHCAQPFGQTAEAVSHYRAWAEVHLHSPFQLVQMTATPSGDVPASEILRDEQDDREDPVLGKRLTASKPARLIVAEKARGKDWQKHLVNELVEQADQLMTDPVRAVGVIVNRVATARQVFTRLAEKHADEADVILLTGRMRPLDRDRVVEQWLRKLESNSGIALDRPVYVVATQCLEVGADLDFHALATECASLDALRQRLGRLNRVGARDFAPAVIVVRADQTELAEKPENEDPVYGNSLPLTWKWLRGDPPADEVDMGVVAIRERLEATDAEQRVGLNAPSPDAPVLFPAHLDCWVQTDPVPCPDPDPAVFLHGPRRGIPDVQVVWRADLPETGAEGDWKEIVSLCPPSSAEAMPVPLPVFRDWLARRDRTDDSGDVEGQAISGEEEQEVSLDSRRVLRWWGPDNDRTCVVTDPRDVRPGDTLVVPVWAGGSDVFGHIPAPEDTSRSPRYDLGDEAFQRSRDVALLRITPALIDHWPVELQSETLTRRVTDPELLEEPAERDRFLTEALTTLATSESAPEWMRTAAGHLVDPDARTVDLHPIGGWVVRGRRRLNPHRPATFFTDEDDTASALETVPRSRTVSLACHCQGVESIARTFASGSGLPDPIVEALGWAGRWHDLGKADRRFQALLWNLPRRAISIDKPLLAKSETVPRSVQARRLARERSGYPREGRHELLSTRLAETRLDRLPDDLDRDLVLHLIASHHGHCRPFAPVVEDVQPEALPAFEHLGETFAAHTTTTGLERLDSGVPERFWRLVRRYGWWGLAYLEAILRLADHRRSEQEQDDGEGQKP
jgi:CRISPR-associated endonuclease/helicase Cas3